MLMKMQEEEEKEKEEEEKEKEKDRSNNAKDARKCRTYRRTDGPTDRQSGLESPSMRQKMWN